VNHSFWCLLAFSFTRNSKQISNFFFFNFNVVCTVHRMMNWFVDTALNSLIVCFTFSTMFRHITRAVIRESSYLLSLLSTALCDTTYNGPFYSVMITSRKTLWWWHVWCAETCCRTDNVWSIHLMHVKLVLQTKSEVCF
jgi:hypothetical protein